MGRAPLSTSDDREKDLNILKSIARAIVETFGPDVCEVVIHDLSDLEHSIIWIEGDVTHRGPGDSMTDLGLRKIREGDLDDLFNYRTYLEDGRTLKSSSIFLNDSDGRPWGSFCINFDVTALLNLQHFLGSFVAPGDAPEIEETFTGSIEDTLQKMVANCVAELGKSVHEMTREERLQLIKMLDERGAFQVRRAVPCIAHQLNVSRYTVYNYLSEIHGDDD